jgi:DNA adenine methylase
MKTPITYYGGKQKLLKRILKMIPEHKLYAEPFVGGAAIFFGKETSKVEVINDTNKELINFYRTVQNDFVGLEKMVRISLHSRTLHADAKVMYENPHLFTEIQRAWAVWILAAQSFSSMLNGTWGYDIAKNSTSLKINNKRTGFTEDYAIRLQNVQIECTDAIRIIQSRDTATSFFYIDPPYVGSDCGHYNGYTQEDFDRLMKLLSRIKGKFLLSSYPNKSLTEFIQKKGWFTEHIQMDVTVAAKSGKRKPKTEVLTANYNFNELN